MIRSAETVASLKAMLNRHLRRSIDNTAELGGELAKRWSTIDSVTRRALQRRLEREHRFTRWLIRRLKDDSELARWCARINRTHAREAWRQRAKVRQRDALQENMTSTSYMIDGLMHRDVQ